MSNDVDQGAGGRQRAPEIYDYVDAPDGHECRMWSPDESGNITPCDRGADLLVVYEGSLDPDDDLRKNVLTCIDCAPIVKSEVMLDD